MEDTIRAFQVSRDAGLKVTAHMMPGLPGATPEEDLEGLRQLFDDDRFKPDMSKLYPTLIIPGTALAGMFEAGLFEPYSQETVVDLLSEMKRFVPPWHRIMRIQREIPAKEIEGGPRNGNLRQLVLEKAADKGIECGCIRCREVALRGPEALGRDDSLRYRELRYAASGGTEVFGSYEFERSRAIAAFVRLRLPSDRAHRPEVKGAAVVRELRTYGKIVEIGSRDSDAWQHRGLGRSLMSRAEEIAGELGASRLLVTSAVGTRNYYRKLGYRREGPYMSKPLS